MGDSTFLSLNVNYENEDGNTTSNTSPFEPFPILDFSTYTIFVPEIVFDSAGYLK